MREVVLDTETTGRSVAGGHRLCSIGMVELIYGRITGNEREFFCNPERKSDPDAYRVHGLSDAFLAEQSIFRNYTNEIADFIGEDPIIAHHAPFDRSFVNNEFAIASGFDNPTESERNRFPAQQWKDSVLLARKKYPKQDNSLDGLCDRFGIHRSHRIKHGALKDARLLALVWIELQKNGQGDLFSGDDEPAVVEHFTTKLQPFDITTMKPQRTILTRGEARAHKAFWGKELGEKSIWSQYWGDTSKAEGDDKQKT